MSDLTLTANQDGSLSHKDDKGMETRYVKESDLLASKGASESKLKEWETNFGKLKGDFESTSKDRDSTHQLLLQEQAAREQLESKVKELEPHRTLADTRAKEIEGHKKSLADIEKELTDLKRSMLVDKYHIDLTKVKDMTLAQLREAEKVVSVLGITASGNKPKYDGGAGGSGSTTETPLERAKRELSEYREKVPARR